MFSWLLVLVVLMVGGSGDAKRRRTGSPPRGDHDDDEEGSEYQPGDDSDHDSDDGLDSIHVETRSKAREQQLAQEKGKAQSTSKSKGKGKVASRTSDDRTFVRDKQRGVFLQEPTIPPPQPHMEAPGPVDSKRLAQYGGKHCVGERYFLVDRLFEKVPGFQALFEAGNLHAISNFSETTGYCLELIREFYMRGGNLIETEGGPYQFTTSVRGVGLVISPETIGHVLEMPAFTGGVSYMSAGLDAVQDWKRVLNALCLPEAENNGSAILSKDLRLEYRFLNFLVCYNIMPLANTKVIRWDRVLYMYLLGRPHIIQERNLNVNIPFLVWTRMARELKTANYRDRLPFPLLIMRILRFHDVNVDCTSLEHPHGPVGETTMIKSRMQLHGLAPRVPEGPPPASPPPAQSPPPAPGPSAPGSDTDASISSVYREQQRLSGEIERLASDNAQAVANQSEMMANQAKLVSDVARLNKKYGRISRFLRLLCSKMGCSSSEMPEPDSGSD